MLAFPERRIGLQEIHDEMRARKGCFAMAARCEHKNDLRPDGQHTITVDDAHGLQRPASLRLGDDPLDLGFRHARIVLKFQRLQAPVFTAAIAYEACNCANIRRQGSECGGF
jgi:hypothetical protein